MLNYAQKNMASPPCLSNGKKLKILILIEDYLPICGGVTSVVHNTALALKDYVDITIGTVQAKKIKGEKKFKDTNEGFDIFRCKGFYNPITTNMQPMIGVDLNFSKHIESKKYDIIHCHFPLRFFAYAKKIAKKQNIPVIITAHAILYEDIKNFVKLKGLAKFVTKIAVSRLNSADNIWVVSDYAKNYLSNFGLRKDSKVMLNAVSKPKDFELVDIYKNYNIPKNKFMILSVSRLVRVKNIELLIQTMPFLDDNVIFVVVGSGPDEKRLKSLAKSLEVEYKVFFIGQIENKDVLNSFYSNANLISFTSIGDSAGLIQHEASYFEKPTLAIENTAISENIKDGFNGFVIKNNIADCAKKIRFCVNHPNIVSFCGKNAKETLFRTYTDPETIQYLLNQYEQTIMEFKVFQHVKERKKAGHYSSASFKQKVV